ncbi:ABC transporter ATP-binding protein [Flavicella sp.]|uniref:ABC transporter ATP-binding protein n=1 Tax=Flavicella sp. TaxID=2957742 RepID=UPI00260B0415|nr:ABC transporter ATP-binding protein [Flavicella sp.]MDG1805184.1 ABC transporter ATP-binding protein [Flavicella sp.]MDG2279404.1 ABC transporter ATP-binding protein [Flavicella sp.]
MLELKNVSFAYDKTEVVKDISFSVNQGEYIAIIGESGCGKSTLLEIIYGLLHIDKGSVFYNDEKLLGPNYYLVPGEPFMKYLSQDFDLMPFTSAAENIGKFLPNRFPKEKKERTAELLEVVDMVDFAHVKVKNLSGGQKQRVALARVLAKEPELLLLDEPFSHIDNFRKNNLRRKLFNYLREKNITCIVATHDSTDALSFADKILVMKEGKLVAENPPKILYNTPPSKYVASFFGDVNEIKLDKISKSTSKKTILLYPQDIKIDASSKYKAIVKQAYFMEGIYLIEVIFDDQILFLQHDKYIDSNKTVGIHFSTEIIKLRSN